MFAKTLTIFFAATIALGFALYTPAQAQYVQDAMIGYWSFDASTIDGDTIIDVSGNGNDATINFGVNVVDGKIGDALEFDGESGHYVDTGLMITEEQYESLTMMAWAKPNVPHESWGSVMGCDDGGWDRGYGYRGDVWEIQVGHGGDWQPGATADIAEWQHTVLVYTPTNVIFYKNGERFEFGDRTTPTTSATPLLIGDDIPCGPNCSFPGAIDEVIIYGRALSDEEVMTNLTGGPSAVAPTDKLTSAWGRIKASK